MNNLNDILTSLDIVKLVGQSDINLTGVNSDSRKVEAGNMFVATRGTQVDGHDYIQSAIEKGAVAIVCEILPKTLSSDVAYVVVQNANVALGKIASAWYDFPSSSLRLVGVTGTNGKTSL